MQSVASSHLTQILGVSLFTDVHSNSAYTMTEAISTFMVVSIIDVHTNNLFLIFAMYISFCYENEYKLSIDTRCIIKYTTKLHFSAPSWSSRMVQKSTYTVICCHGTYLTPEKQSFSSWVNVLGENMHFYKIKQYQMVPVCDQCFSTRHPWAVHSYSAEHIFPLVFSKSQFHHI